MNLIFSLEKEKAQKGKFSLFLLTVLLSNNLGFWTTECFMHDVQRDLSSCGQYSEYLRQ